MFVKRDLTLSQIHVQLETLYYPKIRDMIQQLSVYSMILAAGNDDEIHFLDVLSHLREELIQLEKWELQVLFPKLLDTHKDMDEFSQAKFLKSIGTAWKFVQVKRNKVFKLTQELREMCNEFVAISKWSENKRKSCEGLFAFYESILQYMNFEELTVLPEIQKLFPVEKVSLTI